MSAVDLTAWRERLGLTQPQAAAALNAPLPTYRHWEHGLRRVPGTVERLCVYIERFGTLS